jgi:hypothetical protein
MRQELTHTLEATTAVTGRPEQNTDSLPEATIQCTISIDGFGQIHFTPDPLTVASLDFVQFTVSSVAGNLTVPANLFGPVGPFFLSSSNPSVKIRVLPNLPSGTSGNGLFTSTNPPNLNGSIPISTGVGDPGDPE